jgi:hypothetical protein
MKTRNLQIEATGDFALGKVKPKIRLTGHWLERAGFKPGYRVAVQISEPGILTLRFLELNAPASALPALLRRNSALCGASCCACAVKNAG